MVCKYFLPHCSLIFYLFSRIFHRTGVFNFEESQFFFPFMDCDFGVKLKNPTCSFSRFSLTVFLRVLCFTFKYMVRFELIFIWGINLDWGIFVLFLLMDVRLLQNHLWKTQLFSTELLLYLYQNSVKSYNNQDFPGGPVVNNPFANAGDVGLIPGAGRFHMYAKEQLSPWTPTTSLHSRAY